MALNVEQYNRIRDILYDDWGSAELDQLKILFTLDINSKRRVEKIKTLPSLFRVLEKRDILGPEHIESLNRVIGVCAPRSVEINNIISNRTGYNVYGHGMGSIRMEQAGKHKKIKLYPIWIKDCHSHVVYHFVKYLCVIYVAILELYQIKD